MMFRAVRLLAALVVTLTSCAPLQRLAGGAADDLAADVLITRDEWGVPHVHGDSDAAALFGLAYAMAEDNYWQIEEDYIHALGRAAHWYGAEYLAADMMRAAFEVERLSREEYDREPRERRVLWDAFAEGLNHYVRTSGERPRLIAVWEPWMLFARARSIPAGATIDGVRLGADTARDGTYDLVGVWDESGRDPVVPLQSGAWAVAPSRTTAGHALLLQSAHRPFAGPGQLYEAQISSNTGWNVRGFAVLGMPVPRTGHNQRLAWGHTESDVDGADIYELTFDPADRLQYRFDGGWRRAEEWQDTLLVNTDDGVRSRVVTFRRSHHGPIVALRDGRALAARIARMEDGGSLQQWYAMGRALTLDDFRAALDQRALVGLNTLYADVDGNLYYVHGNAVPARDTQPEWSRPVDGAVPGTDWRGYHSLGDLPQVLNPAGGWIHSVGGMRFEAVAEAHDVDAAAFPAYMAPAGASDAARVLERILDSDSAWALDAFALTAFDDTVARAEEEIALLALEWEQVGGRNPNRARALDEVIDTLRAWDQAADVNSAAATLYILWQERLRGGAVSGELERFRAMEEAMSQLEQDRGTHFVAWGEVHRLQRGRPAGEAVDEDEPPSLPVAGAPGITGAIFRMEAEPSSGGRRYAVSGRAWIHAVELAPQIRSRSIVPFGQSGRPESRHYFDQAGLLARSELKPMVASTDTAPAAERRAYRPPPRPR